jgi:choline kinase
MTTSSARPIAPTTRSEFSDGEAMPPAVILAAGAGSRLYRDGDPPKPLMVLMGMTLIERSMRTAATAGVDRFIVVAGHRGDEVAECAVTLGYRLGLDVEIAESLQWELGNGASALACEPYVDDRFFVLMSDHIYSPQFLRRLVNRDDGERACALVVDRNLPSVYDLDEATKVRLGGAEITAISKTLTEFDAADTGVFMFRQPLFDALREAAANGEHTLGSAVQILAERRDATWVPANGLLWQDIDTQDDLAVARERLLVDTAGRSEAAITV